MFDEMWTDSKKCESDCGIWYQKKDLELKRRFKKRFIQDPNSYWNLPEGQGKLDRVQEAEQDQVHQERLLIEEQEGWE